jgi:hypothetical protein
MEIKFELCQIEFDNDTALNCAKLNKSNLICLWKENLNSDGQQFHQYQQNKQSLLNYHLKPLNFKTIYIFWMADFHHII